MSKYEYLNEYTGGNNNDFENDGIRNKSTLDDIKRADKGYHAWQKRVPGLRKSVKIEVYSSGFTGSEIRDAITGERHKGYLVGSASEDLFFSVRMCGGTFHGSDGITLFFDSPEDYERHLKVSLNDEVKEVWYEKKLLAMSRQRVAPTSSRKTIVK